MTPDSPTPYGHLRKSPSGAIVFTLERSGETTRLTATKRDDGSLRLGGHKFLHGTVSADRKTWRVKCRMSTMEIWGSLVRDSEGYTLLYDGYCVDRAVALVGDPVREEIEQ